MAPTNYSKYFTHYITKSFAHSLFSIFIPIYLYANGFSILQVGAFYVVQEIVNFILTYILYRKVYDWGIRTVTVVAVLAQIILVFLTYTYLTPAYTFLFVLAFIRGIHDSFYWGTHGMFIVHLSDKKTGNFLGKWYFLTTVFQVATIPLSGYALDNYSPFWLVVSSIIIYGISLIPLMKIKLNPLCNNSRTNILPSLRKKENRYIFLMSHLNEFFTKINDSLIPLFIFFVFGKFFSIGIAAIFATLGEGFYSFVIGNHSDKTETRKKLLYFNIVSYLLLLILIVFVKNYALFFAIMILAFFRTGTVISSEAGINKSCLDSECYSKKLLGRLGENIAGILIGVAIIIAGLTTFSTAFFISSVYILFSFLVIRKFIKYSL